MKKKRRKTGKGLGIRNGKERGENGARREKKRQTQLNPFLLEK